MIRVGIIGLGFAGKIHIEKLSDIPYVCINALCDIDSEKIEIAKDFLSKLGAKRNVFSSRDFTEIMPHCDVVFIATPAKTHYHILKEAIEARKHVFVEKPLTTKYKEGEEIFNLAQEKGVVVQVGHVERFNDAFIFGKQYVSLPGYIKGERLSQFPGRGTDIDVIFDLMIHDIDAVVGFLNGNAVVDSVETMGIPVITDKPDIAMARIRFSSGCIADLTASRVSYRKFRKMRIFQPGVYISIDFLERRVEIYRKERENGKFEIKATIKSFENSDPMKMEVTSFISSVVEGKPFDLSEAMKSVFIAEKVRESLFFMPEGPMG